MKLRNISAFLPALVLLAQTRDAASSEGVRKLRGESAKPLNRKLRSIPVFTYDDYYDDNDFYDNDNYIYDDDDDYYDDWWDWGVYDDWWGK